MFLTLFNLSSGINFDLRSHFYRSRVKNLQRYLQKDRSLFIKNIEQLAVDPFTKSNVRRLVDFDAAAFRLRVGNIGFYLIVNHIQIIEEHGKAKFAVLDFDDYLSIKALLTEQEKLEDYLDYLHMQAVKQSTSKRFTLKEVKLACDP